MLRFVTVLVGTLSSSCFSSIIQNPESKASYEIAGKLGDGRWGIVHVVRTTNGARRAMKSDKVPVGIREVHREADALSAIRSAGLSGRSPSLYDHFTIPTIDREKGTRYSIQDVTGESVVSELRKGLLTEVSAASICLQMVDCIKEIQTRAGYVHNDLHVENIAFRSREDKNHVLLIDFGDSVPVLNRRRISTQDSLYAHDRVLRDFVLPVYATTDPVWFEQILKSDSDDQIVDLMNWTWDGRFSQLAKAMIRNARIHYQLSNELIPTLKIQDSIVGVFNEIVRARYPDERDLGWFQWAMAQADEEHHIAEFIAARDKFTPSDIAIINSTRVLARQIHSLEAERSDFQKAVLTILQVFSIGNPLSTDHEWFRQLMRGPRADLAAFLRTRRYVPEMLMMLEAAWDQGRSQSRPDYRVLETALNRILTREGFVYASQVIWAPVNRGVAVAGPFDEAAARAVTKEVIAAVTRRHAEGFFDLSISAGSVVVENLNGHYKVFLQSAGQAMDPRMRAGVPKSIASVFDAETVMKKYISHDDKNWVQFSLKNDRNDDNTKTIMSWMGSEPLGRLMTRNSRIFERTRAGQGYSTLPLRESVEEIFDHFVRHHVPGTGRQWFIDVVLGASDQAESSWQNYVKSWGKNLEQHGLLEIIEGMRLLSRYHSHEQILRMDFARVVEYLVAIQPSFDSAVQTRPNWFNAAMAQEQVDAKMIEKMGRITRKAFVMSFNLLRKTKGITFESLLDVLNDAPYVDIEFTHVEAPRSGEHKATLIYLHGMTSTAQKQLDMMRKRNFFQTLGETFKIVAPQIRVTKRNPKVEWFPFLLNPWDDVEGSLGDRDSLDEAVRILLPIIDEEAKLLGGDYSKIFIMGTSKGGMMAAWFGLMANRAFGGVVNYIGSFPLLETKAVSQLGKNVPVIHIHDKKDTIVKYHFAEEGMEVARKAGAQGYTAITEIPADGPFKHDFSDNGLALVSQWLMEASTKK